MSIAIMTDVWKLPMEAHRKLILLSLADNANDGGGCWPSQKTIAARASISERSLRDHLHALASEGWITVVSLGNGRGHSTEYLLNVPKIKAAKAEAEDTKAELDAGKAEAASRPTVIEPSDLPTTTDLPRARELFVDVFGFPPNKLLDAELDGVEAVHPAECVGWTFRETAAVADPSWKLARWMFNRCGEEGHGPRERKHLPARAARSTARAGSGSGGVDTSGVDPAFGKYADD